MNCINDVLHDQLDCVVQLLQPVGREAVLTPQTFKAEREHSMLQGCISSIRARIQKFKDMNDEAARLSGWVSAVVPLQNSSDSLIWETRI